MCMLRRLCMLSHYKHSENHWSPKRRWNKITGVGREVPGVQEPTLEIFSIELASQELLYSYQPPVHYNYQTTCNIHACIFTAWYGHSHLVIGVRASAWSLGQHLSIPCFLSTACINYLLLHLYLLCNSYFKIFVHLNLSSYDEIFLLQWIWTGLLTGGATGAICPGPHLGRGPRWGPCYIIKIDWNTLIQQSP